MLAKWALEGLEIKTYDFLGEAYPAIYFVGQLVGIEAFLMSVVSAFHNDATCLLSWMETIHIHIGRLDYLMCNFIAFLFFFLFLKCTSSLPANNFFLSPHCLLISLVKQLCMCNVSELSVRISHEVVFDEGFSTERALDLLVLIHRFLG